MNQRGAYVGESRGAPTPAYMEAMKESQLTRREHALKDLLLSELDSRLKTQFSRWILAAAAVLMAVSVGTALAYETPLNWYRFFLAVCIGLGNGAVQYYTQRKRQFTYRALRLLAAPEGAAASPEQAGPHRESEKAPLAAGLMLSEMQRHKEAGSTILSPWARHESA